MLDLLFSAAVIASLLVAGSAAFGVSVVLRFLPDKRRLERRADRAQAALTKVRNEIAEKEATIQQLKSEVDMLKPLYARLNDYHEQLTQMRLEAERQELAADEDDDDDDDLFERHRPVRI